MSNFRLKSHHYIVETIKFSNTEHRREDVNIFYVCLQHWMKNVY